MDWVRALHLVGQSLQGALILAMLGAYAWLFERRWPIDPKASTEKIIADWKLMGVSLGLPSLLAPVSAVCASFIISGAGGGLIKLRTDGVWYLISLAQLVVATDLYKYWFHRMQHAVPFFWELHSFHHSAEAITFITGARHHWIERVIVAAALPILPLLFKIPPSLALITSIIFFLPDTCAHANVRVPLGRAVTWINNPQWHRIHHSTRPEHRDKNFAALLPFWDLLFGTACIPQRDEYPATGLVPGERVGVLEGVVWPFRRYLRR